MAFLEYLRANLNFIYAVIAIGIAIVVNTFFGLSKKQEIKKLSLAVALMGMGASIFFTIYSFITRGVSTSMVLSFGSIHLAEMLLILFIALNLLVFLSLGQYNQDDFTKIIIIFLFGLASLLVLVLSRNFLAILVAWSLFVLSNFLLITGGSGEKESTYILKFFLNSVFALLLMLIGFSFLYSVTDFKNLQQVLESGSPDNPFYGISFLFIMFSVFIFMCAYPLHGNYLKLVKRTNSMVTSVIWLFYLPAGFIILLKFREVAYYFLTEYNVLPPVLLAIAAICILGPAIGAFSTRSLKRILGFNYLTFIGLALLGFSLFSAGMVEGSRLEWMILANILNMVICIIPVWVIFSRLPDSVDSLKGFMRGYTYLGINMFIVMLSWLGMAGTPGYMLRHFMLAPLAQYIREGNTGLLSGLDIATLAVVCVAFLLIAANMVRLWVFMFSGSKDKAGPNVYYHRAYHVYVTLFTLLVLALGIWGLLELTGVISASGISVINPGFLRPPS